MHDFKAHVSILELSELTGLPVSWLKSEADAGRIPHIRAGRRRFFNVEAVAKVLSERSVASMEVANANAK